MTTPDRQRRARAAARLLAAAALLLSACADDAAKRDKALEPAADEFSVMTYNVRRYCLDDRDRDGQAAEPKPKREIDALIQVIRRANPDVLAIQEMGPYPMLVELQGLLSDAGLKYDHIDFCVAPTSGINVAVLSRLPIVESAHVTNETYTMGSTVMPVQRGFANVVIEPRPGYRFRLFVAHLKSKHFHPLGQTEMRRNEARLLNKHVRRYLRDDPAANILVVGDMNDTYPTDAIRELAGTELIDLRPADYLGDAWTHFWAAHDEYARIDYLFVSQGMKREHVKQKSRAVRDPMTNVASDHRPLVGVFKTRDI